MKIKFCGIRRLEDVELMNEFVPEYVGFIFAAQSKRKVKLPKAAMLHRYLLPSIKAVGIFVNEPIEQLLKTALRAGLSAIQLHGDENLEYIENLKSNTDLEIWKAVRVRSVDDIHAAELLPVDKLVLDAYSPLSYGGTGTKADWNIIKEASVHKPYFLAGGLDIHTLPQALSSLKPYGVDISSGIETKGIKDHDKIKAIYSYLKEQPKE